MPYQRKTLSSNANIGDPGPLPAELIGLADASLADLGWTDPALGYADSGFFPVAYVPTLAERQGARLAELQALYLAKLSAGFPITTGGVADSLQLRDATDRTNWLTLKGACDDALAAGLGDQPCPLPIRTTANRSLALSFAEAAQMMRDLRSWAANLMGTAWAKTDTIRSATDEAALDAIDLTTGWPA